MIKTVNTVGMEETYLNIMKAIYEESTDIILNGQKLSFLLKIRNKTRVSAFITFIQHSTGRSSHSDQIRKRNESHPD